MCLRLQAFWQRLFEVWAICVYGLRLGVRLRFFKSRASAWRLRVWGGFLGFSDLGLWFSELRNAGLKHA